MTMDTSLIYCVAMQTNYDGNVISLINGLIICLITVDDDMDSVAGSVSSLYGHNEARQRWTLMQEAEERKGKSDFSLLVRAL